MWCRRPPALPCALCNRPVRGRSMHVTCEQEVRQNGWPPVVSR